MKTTEIKEKIAEKLSSASEEVATAAVNEIANAEIARRTDLVVKSIKLIDKMTDNRVELEVADVVTYTTGGEEEKKYSKQRFEEISKIKSLISKLSEASDLALKENTEEAFGKLESTICETKSAFLNY